MTRASKRNIVIHSETARRSNSTCSHPGFINKGFTLTGTKQDWDQPVLEDKEKWFYLTTDLIVLTTITLFFKVAKSELCMQVEPVRKPEGRRELWKQSLVNKHCFFQ